MPLVLDTSVLARSYYLSGTLSFSPRFTPSISTSPISGTASANNGYYQGQNYQYTGFNVINFTVSPTPSNVTITPSAGFYVDIWVENPLGGRVVKVTTPANVSTYPYSFVSHFLILNRDGAVSQFYPDSVSVLINGKVASNQFPPDALSYYSNMSFSVYSYGYRFYFKTVHEFYFNQASGYSGPINRVTFRLNDPYIWTFTNVSGGDTTGDVILSLDSNFNTLNTQIDNSTTEIVNKIDATTGQVTTAITDSSNRIIATVTSTPAQNQTAQTQKDEMHQATTQIQYNVQAIEDKTNRPDPEKTAQDIDPLGRLDPSDPARVSMYDGLGAILKTDFFLTVLLMVFGMAFCAYVLFGKRG